MEALQKQDPAILKTMSRSLIDEAGMCGLPSVYFLFGALRHFRPVMPIYSYEGPFGVGYGVALYLPEGQANGLKNRLSPTSASAWPGKASRTT